MADNLKDVGNGDRIRASMQRYEVQHLAQKHRVSWQAALGAIRAAGPMRKNVEAYIRDKKNSSYSSTRGKAGRK